MMMTTEDNSMNYYKITVHFFSWLSSSRESSNDRNTYSLSGCQFGQASPAGLLSILFHVGITTPISSGLTQLTSHLSLCLDEGNSHICLEAASMYDLNHFNFTWK